jgi:hypothetical protein
LSVDDPWFEHVASHFDYGAQGSLGSDDRGDGVHRHPVLDAGDESRGAHQRLDQFARPSCVVGLDADEDDIERISQLSHFAQVERTHLRGVRFPRHYDADALGAHGFDVSRPLLDKRHVKPRANHIRPNRRALGSSSNDRDPFFSGHPHPIPNLVGGWSISVDNRRYGSLPPDLHGARPPSTKLRGHGDGEDDRRAIEDVGNPRFGADKLQPADRGAEKEQRDDRALH